MQALLSVCVLRKQRSHIGRDGAVTAFYPHPFVVLSH